MKKSDEEYLDQLALSALACDLVEGAAQSSQKRALITPAMYGGNQAVYLMDDDSDHTASRFEQEVNQIEGADGQNTLCQAYIRLAQANIDLPYEFKPNQGRFVFVPPIIYDKILLP